MTDAPQQGTRTTKRLLALEGAEKSRWKTCGPLANQAAWRWPLPSPLHLRVSIAAQKSPPTGVSSPASTTWLLHAASHIQRCFASRARPTRGPLGLLSANLVRAPRRLIGGLQPHRQERLGAGYPEVVSEAECRVGTALLNTSRKLIWLGSPTLHLA